MNNKHNPELEISGWTSMLVCIHCKTEIIYTVHEWPTYCSTVGKNVYDGPARYVDNWFVRKLKSFIGYTLKVQTRQDLVDEIVAKETINKATPKENP